MIPSYKNCKLIHSLLILTIALSLSLQLKWNDAMLANLVLVLVQLSLLIHKHDYIAYEISSIHTCSTYAKHTHTPTLGWQTKEWEFSWKWIYTIQTSRASIYYDFTKFTNFPYSFSLSVSLMGFFVYTKLQKAPWEIKFSQSYALEQSVYLVSLYDINVCARVCVCESKAENVYAHTWRYWMKHAAAAMTTNTGGLDGWMDDDGGSWWSRGIPHHRIYLLVYMSTRTRTYISTAAMGSK